MLLFVLGVGGVACCKCLVFLYLLLTGLQKYGPQLATGKYWKSVASMGHYFT